MTKELFSLLGFLALSVAVVHCQDQNQTQQINCPTPPTIQGFNPQNLQGNWKDVFFFSNYQTQNFNNQLRCSTVKFQPQQNGEIQVTYMGQGQQAGQQGGQQTAGQGDQNQVVATLKPLQNQTAPNVFEVSYQNMFNELGNGQYAIWDTDFQNYLITSECRPDGIKIMGFINEQNANTQSLDLLRQRMEALMPSFQNIVPSGIIFETCPIVQELLAGMQQQRLGGQQQPLDGQQQPLGGQQQPLGGQQQPLGGQQQPLGGQQQPLGGQQQPQQPVNTQQPGS